jgi:hypothetical protein
MMLNTSISDFGIFVRTDCVSQESCRGGAAGTGAGDGNS